MHVLLRRFQWWIPVCQHRTGAGRQINADAYTVLPIVEGGLCLSPFSFAAVMADTIVRSVESGVVDTNAPVDGQATLVFCDLSTTKKG